MADLMPRSFWPIPSQRIASFIDDLDDLMPIAQMDSSNAISISEDDQHIHIEASIPGVEPDDIEVTFDKGMVWIRGEVQEEEKDKKRKYYQRAARAFSYRIAVPGDIDPNAKPKAESRNGIIKITFPKKESSMPQKITIKRSNTDGETRQKKSSEK